MFAFQDSRGPVDVAFTDRHGGVSGGPYASLNLAASGADDPAAVEQNITRVASAFAGSTTDAAAVAPPVIRMRQVHGADVHVVDSDPATREPAVADALVTTVPGLVLMVRVADCVPVLLADVSHRVVGAAHAGRPGLVAGIVPAAVAAMRDLGAEQLTAWVGPHVCGRCYEVPAAMRDQVSAVVPEAFAETSWGTPAVDVGAGVRAQLAAAGAHLVDASRCTIEDDDLFSYRRQGKESGRLAGLIRVRP
ncbi:MAG TPA: peptidoglycan editing factor PgeF [Nocardioidaceae bacterium]|nr:peptidoglycan editing factor PgeF [Nocardioidaceae bacterium]